MAATPGTERPEPEGPASRARPASPAQPGPLDSPDSFELAVDLLIGAIRHRAGVDDQSA
ncbi:hypothetical protein GXW82_05335 [Streptacidiphilus sp. 4-A2]|nr:hypothetical protein [Streptacidiphilus sp. 4-A2]